MLRLHQQQDCNMRAESSAGAERQPPQQWAIFVIAVIADLSTAFGFVPPQYAPALRAVVMYCLYREWSLGFACGWVLPRSLPLAGVCFLKQKWLALKVSVTRRGDQDKKNSRSLNMMFPLFSARSRSVSALQPVGVS